MTSLFKKSSRRFTREGPSTVTLDEGAVGSLHGPCASFAENAVERIFLPFVGFQQLVTAFEVEKFPLEHLRDVITAGEQLQITPQVRTFFESTKSLHALQPIGPSESHVVTAYTLRGAPGKWPLLPPIGRPITKARIHILEHK